MKTNIHCRAELDPLYRAMRILEAEEEGLESALWDQDEGQKTSWKVQLSRSLR